ncbi:expressed unknown protein [Seminavis robusta]|uniref:Uncharacterized protein n=1 Tax=Seminavis robusta TaxID=568900 RepID=A0A9N8EXQ5_9STRA|nr:expressed unknown protein [Seminavis robusta]|eukprot:Sro1866_g302520.1 n/a (69) ;mRNA; f:13872-14176
MQGGQHRHCGQEELQQDHVLDLSSFLAPLSIGTFTNSGTEGYSVKWLMRRGGQLSIHQSSRTKEGSDF